jgi:multiple sugar transport system permease protein
VKRERPRRIFPGSVVPYAFVGPAFVLLAAFGVLPIFVAGFVSLTDLDIAGLADSDNVSFIGLDNYRTLLADDDFLRSIRITLLFVAVGVPAIVVVSLAIAFGLNQSSSRYFRALRIFYFLPAITAIVAISLVWGLLYNTQFGLINHVFDTVGLPKVNWLSDPTMAKVSVGIVAVWRATGLNSIIFLAALQSIPNDYYEAASLDGAGEWHKFRFITLPLMRFALMFVTITTMIAWLQFFDEPFVLTEGGPVGATTSVSLFVYDEGFSRNQFGYASAGTVALFVVILAVTSVQLRVFRRGQHA